MTIPLPNNNRLLFDMENVRFVFIFESCFPNNSLLHSISTYCSVHSFFFFNSRLFCFELLNEKLWVVGNLEYHKCCIFKVRIWRVASKVIAATFAADGMMALWDVTSCVQSLLQLYEYQLKVSEDESGEDRNTSEESYCKTVEQLVAMYAELQPFFQERLHLCGINSIDWKLITTNIILVVTGGDDSAVRLTVVNLSGCHVLDESVKAEILSSTNKPSAHSSQVTGKKFYFSNR